MNYEALGRYTSARDVIDRALARRNIALLSLTAQAKSASAPQTGRTLAQPLNANAVASDADRPQLKIG